MTTAVATPASSFLYVDTAFGGVNRRNHVKRIDQIYVNGAPDCYASHLRAGEDLVEHWRTHRNAKGNNTVKAFPGAVWTDSLHFDFDYPDDPTRALLWLRMVLDRLEVEDVPLDAIRMFFSGSKGFHAEIPHTLFGGFQPSAELHTYLKRAATEIMGGIPFDGSVYDKLRLWRLPNTRHGKTNRYKIQLTLEEVRTLDLRAISALAVNPRDPASVPALRPVDDDEWQANGYLVEVWARAQKEPARNNERVRGTPTDEARNRLIVAAIAGAWPHSLVGVSRHADYLLPLAGFLAVRMDADEVADLLKEGARAAGDASFLQDHTRDWEGEIDRMVESSDEKVRGGQAVTGLPTIARRWPELANVLAALWPGSPRLEIGEPEQVSSVLAVDWPLPDPIMGPPPAPDFPLALLPKELADVAADAAERQQAPADFVVWPLIVSAAGLIGRGAGIRPRAFDDWTERLALWVAQIGPPSSLKSPAQEEGTRPLRRQQERDHEIYVRATADWKADCAAAKAADPRHPDLPPAPVERRCWTADVTVEKLATLLVPEVSRGLTGVRDELAGLILDMDKYHQKGGDRQFYLQAYSGGPYTVDRITRESLFVPDLLINIVGGIQPDVARTIFGGGPDDGFAARFLSVWPELPQSWRRVDRWPNRVARQALDAISDKLAAAVWDAELAHDDFKPTPFCRLAPDGQHLFDRWHESTMVALRSGAYEGRLEGRVGKYPGLAARLILVWHLLEWAAGRAAQASMVEPETVADVLTVMDDYVLPMEQRVYTAYAVPADAEGGRRIARWLVATRPERITAREIRRHDWGGLDDQPSVNAALEWLVTRNWLAEAEPEKRPGRPSAIYLVNPRLGEVNE